MDNNAIDWLVDLDDEEFREAVSQAAKARDREPEKWQALLDPRVIESTLDALDWFVEQGEAQSQDPARFPRAHHFLKRMRGYRTDVMFTLKLRGEG